MWRQYKTALNSMSKIDDENFWLYRLASWYGYNQRKLRWVLLLIVIGVIAFFIFRN